VVIQGGLHVCPYKPVQCYPRSGRSTAAQQQFASHHARVQCAMRECLCIAGQCLSNVTPARAVHVRCIRVQSTGEHCTCTALALSLLKKRRTKTHKDNFDNFLSRYP
jgi:hypothetical protein